MRKLLLVLLAACGGPAPAPQAPHPTPVAPAAPDVAWDQLVGPIKDVDVKAADAALAAKAKDLLAGEVGKELDRTQLREVTSKLFALGGIADVLVRGIQRADGITLEIDVTQQPIVHAINATNGVTLGSENTKNMRLDPAQLDSLVRQLRDKYLANGYVDAQVHWSTKPAGDQVDVSIDIAPGTAIIVDKVDFKGNAHAKSDELAKAIADSLAKGTPFTSDRAEKAQLELSAYYFDRGYVNVQVAAPAPASSIVFNIQEGDQFRVGKLSIKDAKPADEKKWLALLGVKKGDIFSRAAMTAGMKKLQDATKAQDITPLTKVDAAKKTIDVELELKSP